MMALNRSTCLHGIVQGEMALQPSMALAQAANPVKLAPVRPDLSHDGPHLRLEPHVKHAVRLIKYLRAAVIKGKQLKPEGGQVQVQACAAKCGAPQLQMWQPLGSVRELAHAGQLGAAH